MVTFTSEKESVLIYVTPCSLTDRSEFTDTLDKSDVLCTVHRIAMSILVDQLDTQIFNNVSLFIIKCSTCFGLFSPSSGATFWSGISHLV